MDFVARLLVVQRRAKRIMALMARSAEDWELEGSFKRLRWFGDRLGSMAELLDEIAGALKRQDREAAKAATLRLLSKVKTYIVFS